MTSIAKVRFGAALMAGALLAGCVGAGDPVTGSWASVDGVFVATFDNGAFQSRLTSTGDTVVADGRYRATSNGYNLSWTSIAANEQRSARCLFTAVGELTCTPSAGAPFTMRKVG